MEEEINRIDFDGGYASIDDDWVKIVTFFDENRFEGEEGITHHKDYFHIDDLKAIYEMIKRYEKWRKE